MTRLDPNDNGPNLVKCVYGPEHAHTDHSK